MNKILYKVVLVEDEEFVREAIRDIIDWNSLGYQLVGEAGDGKEAIEIIESTQPDVVLTDICMPFMDGLELTEKVRQISPITKIVIITGYDEFEYAQQGIKLNVFNYILKPITAKEFAETLTKIRETLDREYMEKRDIQRLKDRFEESLDIMRERFFFNLFMGNISREDIRETMEKLDLNLDSDKFIAAVIRIDNITDIDEIFGYDNRPLVHFAVLNVVEEIMAKYNQNIAITDKECQFSLLFIHKDLSIMDFKNHVAQILDEIILCLKKYMNIVASAGLGDECDHPGKIHYSYRDAATALEYRVLMGIGKVIIKSDMERKSSFVNQRIEESLKSLSNTVKIGTWEEIEAKLDDLFNIIRDSGMKLSSFRTVLMELLVNILKIYSDVDLTS